MPSVLIPPTVAYLGNATFELSYTFDSPPALPYYEAVIQTVGGEVLRRVNTSAPVRLSFHYPSTVPTAYQLVLKYETYVSQSQPSNVVSASQSRVFKAALCGEGGVKWSNVACWEGSTLPDGQSMALFPDSTDGSLPIEVDIPVTIHSLRVPENTVRTL